MPVGDNSSLLLFPSPLKKATLMVIMLGEPEGKRG